MADTVQVPQALWGASVPIARKIDAHLLNTDAAESYTVPAGTRWALISADQGFYIRLSGTAVVPAGDVTDGTASMYIPSSLQVKLEEGTTVSMIRKAGVATIVTIARYS